MRILRAIVGPNGEHGPDSFNKHPGAANIYCLNFLPHVSRESARCMVLAIIKHNKRILEIP